MIRLVLSIPTIFSRRGAIASIIILTVLVRLVHLYFITATPFMSAPEFFTESDMHMFDEWSRWILRGDWLSARHSHLYQWQLDAAPAEQWDRWYSDGAGATFHKAPFYAYLVAALRWLFSEPGIPLAIVQIAAAGASALLLFRIAETLFGTIAAAAATLFFALYGPSINYDILMLRRPWISLSMLAVTYVLIRLRASPTKLRALALGFTLGFAILIYEAFVLLPPCVLGVVLWWFRLRTGSILAGGIMLGTVLPLLPVFIRNYLVDAALTKFAVTGSVVFAVFNSAGSDPQLFIADPRVYLPILEQSEGRMWETVWLSLQTFDGIGPAVLFYLKRALALLSPYETPDNLNYYYAALKSPLLSILPGYGLLAASGVTGLGIALWKKVDVSPLVPCGLVALVLLFVTTPLSRYRISLAIVLLPLAGWFVQYLWNEVRAGRLVPAGVGLLSAAAIYAAAYWVESEVLPGAHLRGRRYYRATEFILATDFYLNRGMNREAQDEVNLWVESQRDFDQHGLTTLAMRQARLREFGAARHNLETARSNGQTDARLLGRIGDIYWKFLGDPRAAQTLYREALQTNPDRSLRDALKRRLELLGGR